MISVHCFPDISQIFLSYDVLWMLLCFNYTPNRSMIQIRCESKTNIQNDHFFNQLPHTLDTFQKVLEG